MIKIIAIILPLLIGGCVNSKDREIKKCLKAKECSTYFHKKKGYEVVVDSNDKVIASRYNHFTPGGSTNNMSHFLLDTLPRFFGDNYNYYRSEVKK